MVKNQFSGYLKRFAIVMLVSLAFVWGMSELAHLFMKDDFDRPPEIIELVIPNGTAAKVAEGENVPAIPDSMVFVVGDTLVIRNEDSVDHRLGPVWVPPGASANLLMDDLSNYDYTCSFRPSRYLGLDVREPTTWNIRLIALGYVTPATGLFIFVYSIVIWPIKSRDDQKENGTI